MTFNNLEIDHVVNTKKELIRLINSGKLKKGQMVLWKEKVVIWRGT